MSSGVGERDAPEFVGGRYRVKRLLGRGGMADVYEVVDATTGARRALKRLRDANKPRVARLFELEYHTLSQLAHPRVIAVFDYERHAEGAHYTMELLDGRSLRELSPLPWRRACELLSDICSALSLIHSRRLVHRDLTPRNVHCGAEGKAKLIDFGAMCPFGPSRFAVGTPSFTAPEVLSGQTLDARTDLFSLGATAYYALTRRRAYPAADFAELQNAWRRRPAPPSQIAAGIPKALDDLVLSLLQPSPLGRPGSAAEVMERLSAIAGLAMDEQLLVPQAYLSTPTLVARDAPLLRVREQVLRAVRGRGVALLVRADAGLGRSRFLQACALEGKLQGAVVLSADTRDAAAGAWSAAGALMQQLHLALPQLGPPPAGVAGGLAVGMADREEAGGPSQQRGERYMQLLEYLRRGASQRPLMLVVDDVQRIDEPSLSLLARLAHEARQLPLLIVASLPTAEGGPDGVLRLLAGASIPLELPPLGEADCETLLRSVFGDVPNVKALSHRLHALSKGSPRAVMLLAQHLLDGGRLRYEAGAWTLPERLDAGDLPASLEEALRQRVAALSEGARDLAQALALCGRRSFSLSDWLVVCEHGDRARLLRELDELVAAEIVLGDSERYSLAHPAWTPVLSSSLDVEARPAMHRRLAALLDRHPEDWFLRVRHLLRGGRPAHALELFAQFDAQERERAARESPEEMVASEILPADWVATAEELIGQADALGHSGATRYWLRRWLVLRSVFHAEAPVEHLQAALAQLQHDTGLDLHAAMDDTLEAADKLQRTLAGAQARHEAAGPARRGLSPLEALPELGFMTLMALAVAGRSNDLPVLRALPSLTPFSALSPAFDVIERDVQATKDMLAGRMEAARASYREVLARIAQPDAGGFGAMEHKGLQLAVAFAMGAIESTFAMPSVLDWARDLEASPLQEINAWRLRMMYALSLGQWKLADEYRERLELARLEHSPPQLFDGSHLWLELLCYRAAEDLPRVKACVSALQAMAQKLPEWWPCAQYARSQYQLLRGDGEQALAEAARGLARCACGEHLAWPLLASGKLQALVKLGRAAEAVREGRAMLSLARRAALDSLCVDIARMLALAEAAAGDLEQAGEHADQSIATYQELQARGLCLGGAHETRARVAIAARDQAAFEQHAKLCAEQYRAGDNPMLTAKYERLMHEARRAQLRMPGELASASGGDALANELGDVSRVLREMLDREQGEQRRAEVGLRWLIERCGASGGLLYAMRDGSSRRVAQQGRVDGPRELESLVNAFLTAELHASREASLLTLATDYDTRTLSGERWSGGNGQRLTPLMLAHNTKGGYTVAGMAVLCSVAGGELVVPAGVAAALSAALFDESEIARVADSASATAERARRPTVR